ncbi:hypothetical protein ACQVRE_30785, partial [Bacillus cereus]
STGPTGPTGSTGSTGPTGPTGSTGSILQPFLDAGIDQQTVFSNDPVVFPLVSTEPDQIIISGIAQVDDTTFAISNPGIYVLNVTLNYAPGTTTGSPFAVSINTLVDPVAPAANADTVGPVSIIRVAMYSSGTQIQIRNRSNGGVTLNNSAFPPTIPFSAGHITLYRIADAPLP